ncbi:MAG: EMC3/TMCO1 family protein [Candidatus Bilamarchaeaceae archaeon]
MIPPYAYFWIVTLCGIAYAGISQFIRGKLVDMKRMKKIQKQMNSLNKEYLEALKKRDNRRMDAIQLKQNEIMPEFHRMMVGQLKVMGVVIVIFISFMWGLGAIDPNVEDDFQFQLYQNSPDWCGNLSFGNGPTGPWLVEAKAFSGESEIAQNGVVILYGVTDAEHKPYATTMGEPMKVTSDKEAYSIGESAKICASAPSEADRIVATANSGTWFHVQLPFTVPFLEIKTLSGSNIWFIIVSLLASILMGRLAEGLGSKKGDANDSNKK